MVEGPVGIDGVGVEDDEPCPRVPSELAHELGSHELSGEEHESNGVDGLADARLCRKRLVEIDRHHPC